MRSSVVKIERTLCSFRNQVKWTVCRTQAKAVHEHQAPVKTAQAIRLLGYAGRDTNLFVSKCWEQGVRLGIFGYALLAVFLVWYD